ncbi:MAG TPA: glycosyl hydrolase [Acidimicrobiales bacterium]|nr:glycosyl hydrolase [Acidimicrobiales bacterium]
MGRPRRLRDIAGLPKEIVTGLLIIVVTATATGIFTAPHHPHAPAASPPGGGGAIAATTLPPTTTTTVTVPPTTAPPTTQPAPPPTTAPRAVTRSTPSTTSPPKPPVHVTPPAAAIGVYTGAANPAGAAAFAAATGAHVTMAEDYLPGGPWTGIDGAGGSLSWMMDAWRGSGYRLVLAVPILDNSGNDSLAQGATGAYNQYFVTLAQTLVGAGQSNAILRLGWEFTGNWDSWRVTDTTDAANYAAYFRNIVNAMRSVPGQAFQYIWEGPDPQSGSYPGAYTADDAYPGSAYVDYIGDDYYDQTWNGGCGLAFNNTSTAAGSLCSWTSGTLASLNRVAAYAATKAKPVVFPEWGEADRSDGHGMGDDPVFIQQMAGWISTHDVAFGIYFNFDPPGQQDSITDGRFPAALAEYRAVFG